MMLKAYRDLFLLILAFGWTPTAVAEDFESALALFNDGKFVEAAATAEAVGTSDGLALAASALAIHGYYIAPEDEKQALFDRGMALAVKATELDPNNSEAFLQVSHTKGRYAQTIGVMDAMSEGYAEQIRDALDEAIALDDKNHNAYISLGAWNAEIVAAGFVARALYGASEEDALANFQRALALAPDANNVHLEYAIGLMKLDDGHKPLAREHFQQALALPADNAYARIVRSEAERRLSELDTE